MQGCILSQHLFKLYTGSVIREVEIQEVGIKIGGNWSSRGQDYKENTNSTQNKSQTHRAKQYEVTSFLSTDCELSTETCSKNVYSLGPRVRSDIELWADRVT